MIGGVIWNYYVGGWFVMWQWVPDKLTSLGCWGGLNRLMYLKARLFGNRTWHWGIWRALSWVNILCPKSLKAIRILRRTRWSLTSRGLCWRGGYNKWSVIEATPSRTAFCREGDSQTIPHCLCARWRFLIAFEKVHENNPRRQVESGRQGGIPADAMVWSSNGPLQPHFYLSVLF